MHIRIWQYKLTISSPHIGNATADFIVIVFSLNDRNRVFRDRLSYIRAHQKIKFWPQKISITLFDQYD